MFTQVGQDGIATLSKETRHRAPAGTISCSLLGLVGSERSGKASSVTNNNDAYAATPGHVYAKAL